METGSDRAERERLLQAELAEEFPALEVLRVPGLGWEAYPAGTQIDRGVTLDSLARKLRRRRDEGGPGMVAP